MIVARFCDQAKGKITAGSSKIDRYNGEKFGWFPIENFNFGFEDKTDTSAAGGAGKGAPAKAPAAASTSAAGGAGAGKDGKREFNHLSMDKQVDSVTCLLMELAMGEVGMKKGTDSKQQSKLEVDIHVLSSVQVEQKVDRFIFTNLMIHLEAVTIVSWKISGSGDNRPTEQVALKYERAAMIYVRTPDATKVDSIIGPKGWDQKNSKPFIDGDFNWKPKMWEEYLIKRG